ncbi:MAG TPA: nitroreductase family protein [Bacteroidales bacterium]|nr:nitroreductase family protein [Bacteroidales bacterium]HQI45591.1 nitroreductase family protein [Bacteroidales bacterium]
MSFLDLANKRQSVRKYLNKAVEKEKIERCLEAARIAPSACNSQPWKYIVVNDAAIVQKVAKETYSPIISFNQFVQQAPVIVVIVIEKPKLLSQIGGRIKDKDFYLIDIGISAEHFCLQAAEEGLGTCMLGWFNEKNIIHILGIPSKKRIGLLITLGYADDEQRKKSRKEIEGMRSYNHY